MDETDIMIDDGDGVWPPDDFTGLWEVYWPNRQLKYRAHFINGEEYGEVTCWWDNGNLAQSGVRENGVCKGVWPDYWEDGTKFKETEYEDDDNFVVRWYAGDGNVKRTELWVDGEDVSGSGT